MLHGTGLSPHTTAFNVNQDIKFAQSIGSLERLLDNHSVGFIKEVLLEAFIIDLKVSCSRSKEHASRRRFSSARTIMLNCTQVTSGKCSRLQRQCLRLLRHMRMLIRQINL